MTNITELNNIIDDIRNEVRNLREYINSDIVKVTKEKIYISIGTNLGGTHFPDRGIERSFDVATLQDIPGYTPIEILGYMQESGINQIIDNVRFVLSGRNIVMYGTGAAGEGAFSWYIHVLWKKNPPV